MLAKNGIQGQHLYEGAEIILVDPSMNSQNGSKYLKKYIKGVWVFVDALVI